MFQKKIHTNHTVNQFSKGMSLIEVLVASAIIATSVVSIIGAYGGLTSLSLKNTTKVQAAMLLQEGAEAVRIMRDSGWTNNIASLSNATTYRFWWDNSSGRWRSTTTISMIDSTFDRTFVLSAVSRDATSFNPVTSGGTVDTGTKKVTITVAWRDDSGTTSKSVDMYLHDTYGN
jgi:prepilin-type N-terminal cleavage/methylation domain-containing protein